MSKANGQFSASYQNAHFEEEESFQTPSIAYNPFAT